MQITSSNQLPMDKKQAKSFQLADNLAIKIDQLKIIFNENSDEEVLVLNPLSIEFPKNQIYFIVGDSGSGKTTLINHFNGLIRSKYGNIFVENSKIIGQKRTIPQFKKLRKSVGMVFQFPEYQLFKDTVLKDVMFGPINLGVKKLIAQELGKKYLKKLGISEELFSRSPFNLSGGQKRRVAIAGILAIEPNIVVFDEPTAGLDPVGIEEMLAIIKELKTQNKTVFVITHEMDAVLRLADQVIVLGENAVLGYDTPYNIFTNENIMSKTSLIKPKVIQTIDKLVEKNEKFKKLYDAKPRNIEELANAIKEMI
ncbi:MAG: ATP-binding cassette domain-containing protein [Mycoplasma sp.]